MSREAKSYFSQLSASVPVQDWQAWESEISDAESRRHLDPTVMDVLGACDVACDDKSISAPDPEALTCTERWIQKAIEIEERQCVTFLFIACPC
jgi:hypothetical protein